MKPSSLSVLLLISVFSLPAHAIDFANYQPTLGADSSYSLSFTEVSQGSEDFTYYKDGTPVYYKIGAPEKKDDAVMLGRINTNQNGADITGNFWDIDNNTSGYRAAIYNTSGFSLDTEMDHGKGVIGDITGDFINNFYGGIYNETGFDMQTGMEIQSVIGNITGDFINNTGRAGIDNNGIIGNISGNFIGNESIAYGAIGAISNFGTIGDITGDFVGNHLGSHGNGHGAAIYNYGTIGNISGSFFGNHIDIVYGDAFGGAIDAHADMIFLANGRDNFFTGNYIKTEEGDIVYNAIHTEGADLTFHTANKGNFIFDDNIDGANEYGYLDIKYDLNITGDDTGKFFLNNDIIHAENINVSDTMLIFGEGPYGNGRILASATPKGDGIIRPADATPSITNLSLTNAQFYLHNNYYETVNVLNYTSAGDTLLHINVGKVNGDWVSDVLNVGGNILGETKVVVYSASKDTDLESVLFVDAPNDVEKIRNAFSVYRVYGSPYKWTAKGEHDTGSQWYLTMTPERNEYENLVPDPIEPADTPDLPYVDPLDPEPNPDPKPEIELNPEVMAFRGLQVAAIEQTRSMVNNIRSKVAANKVLPDTCLLVVDDSGLNHGAWVNPIYHTANIDAPVEIEADIWGLEAGFDIQANQNHKLGIFASYRQGEYDLSGKGEIYFSEVGSKIDIDSYMAGLYYRYDYRHLWAFATAHGGIQKADIETNDGVTSDTDGTEVGASAEIGYLFNLSNTLKLEPSLGVFYTEIDFDDAESTYGTNASWDKIRQTEIEAGVKLEKYFEGDHGFTKAYIKPSVIQVITNGDEVRITGLNKISTYEDGTLGRIELGARHAITDALSAYGFVNYTFGSDYDATSLGAGLNYSW